MGRHLGPTPHMNKLIPSVVGLTLAISSSHAFPAVQQYQFTAVLEDASRPFVIAGQSLELGQELTGTFSYDDALDPKPRGMDGAYYYVGTPASHAITLQYNGVTIFDAGPIRDIEFTDRCAVCRIGILSTDSNYYLGDIDADGGLYASYRVTDPWSLGYDTVSVSLVFKAPLDNQRLPADIQLDDLVGGIGYNVIGFRAPSTGTHSGWASLTSITKVTPSIPEPGSAALFGLGAFALLLACRRKTRAS